MGIPNQVHTSLGLLGFLGVFVNQIAFILGLSLTSAANAAIGAGREFSQQRLGSVTSKLGGIPGLGL